MDNRMNLVNFTSYFDLKWEPSRYLTTFISLVQLRDFLKARYGVLAIAVLSAISLII